VEHGRAITLGPEFDFAEELLLQGGVSISAEIFYDDGVPARTQYEELAPRHRETYEGRPRLNSDF